MSFFNFTRAERHEIGWPVFIALSGVFCGLLMLLLSLLPTMWGILFAVGIMIPFIAVLTGDVKRFFLAILLIALPLNLDITIRHSGHLGGAAGFIISLYDITLAVLYVLWISELARNKDDARVNFFPKISFPFFCLLGVATLSALKASNPLLSLFEIVQVLKTYLGFLYIANNIKRRKDVQFVIVFLLLCLFLESLLAIAQYKYDRAFVPSALLGPEKLEHLKLGIPISRVSGTWESYNDFSWYLTFILPISMSLLFSKIRGIYKSMCGLALLGGITALICTLSRAGWYSFGIAVLIVLLLNFRKIKEKTDLGKFLTSAFFILIITLIIATVNPQFVDIVNRRIFSYDYGSAQSRIAQNQVALNIIKAHPILGVGINNYTEVMHGYDNTDIKIASITPYQVHNIFLQMTAEIGIIGLVIFIGLILMVYKEGLRYTKSSEDLMSGIVIGIIAGITAFLIHGLVDASSLGNHLFAVLWISVGLIMAIGKIRPEAELKSLKQSS